MNGVTVTGELVCNNRDEARLVAEYLPEHITSTRAEPGCISFKVTPTDDPLVWRVEERFEYELAFRARQERVARREWGRMTAGIERRYSMDGLSL